MIFSLHLGVVHSVLCQMEGVGHAFAVPRFNLKTYGDRSFTVAAPTIWNSLPLELRACVSVSTFKSKLRLGYSAKLFS